MNTGPHQVGDGTFNVYNMYDTCYPSNERAPQLTLPQVRASASPARGGVRRRLLAKLTCMALH